MKRPALLAISAVLAWSWFSAPARGQQPPPPASQQDHRTDSPAMQAREKTARPGTEREDAERDDPRARLAAQRAEHGRMTTEFKQHLLRQRQQQIANRRLPEANIVATSGPQWVPIGPTSTDYEQNGPFTGFVIDSGRARTILPHPTDPNTVYFLTSGGGLWKTSNFTANPPNWTPLTDGLISTSGGSVAFGRTPSVLYLGLGDPFDVINVAGVMAKSIDGGTNWTDVVDLGAPFSVRDVKVDTSQAQDIVLVATDQGLFRSIDAGVSYSSVAGPVADPFAGKSFWSIVNTSAGWLANAQPCGGLQPATECGTASTLYLSTDHGATWAAITNAGTIFTGAGRTSLAVGTPGSSVVYAFSENTATNPDDQRGLFRSTDGGQTWVDLGLNGKVASNSNTDSPNMDLMNDQAWYNQMMLVDPTDATGNTIYLGGNLSSAKSTDGGATWTLLTNWLYNLFPLPYAHADFHAAAFSNIGGTKTVFFGSDGGLFVSTDGGSTWDNSKNQGLQTFLVYTLSSTPGFPSEVMIGTQDNGTRVRKGATNTYNQSRGGDGVGTAMSQANTNTSITSVPNNSYATNITNQTPDTEEGFNFTQPPLASDSVFEVAIAAPSAASDPTGKVFFTYSGQQVYTTTDGGLTWTIIGKIGGPTHTIPPIAFRALVHGIGVSPLDLLHIGVIGTSGRVALTTDGGTTWSVSNINSFLPSFLNTSSLSWADNSTIYVTSVTPQIGFARVAKSIDGGATWTRADGGLPDVPVNRVIVDPRDVTKQTLIVASLEGVFRSTDGGASWNPYGTGLSNAYVNDLYMPPDGSFLRMGSYGRGVWELPFLTFSGASITDDVASCDHDGVLDNGETGHLTVTLHNDGGSTLSSITGTVSSSNPSVSFPSGTTIVFPSVAAGASTSGSIQVALNGAVGIQQMDFTIAYNDPALSLPGPVTATVSFRGNDDEKPSASANDNIEAQASAWTVTGTAAVLPDSATWERRTISPVEHRWATYDSNVATDVQLVSPALQVGAATFTMSWEQRYLFDFNGAVFFDGMVVEISTDGGTNWNDVTASGTLTPTYDHALAGGTSLLNRPAFDGQSPGYPAFAPVTLNLGTAFANKSVKLRFRVATDTNGSGPGVEIRNITTSGLTNTPFNAVTVQAPCGTATALISSLNPSQFGNNVTFTATVTGGTGTATGNVTFADGATTLGTPALDASGKASFATTALAVGTHPITAAYAGDSNHAASTSPIVQQVVNSAALNSTTTALASSLNPSVSGQSVTFTATVTSTAAGTPTGTVTFKDGATTLGTGALNGSAVATFATSTLTVGSHSITATYGGDATFAASSSTVVTQSVKGTTATAVASSLNPSVFGQAVTLTATVTSTAAGTPTGTVTFKDGAATIGSGVLNGSGIATFGTSALTAGSHSITATYPGDSNFAGSTSSTLTQTVNPAATATAVISSLNPSTFGQSVTFTATVSPAAPGAGTATGTVTFKDGATTLGTGALNAGGMATFATSALATGSHSITAAYGGDANFAVSTSTVLTQTVKGATNTALASSVNPSANGQSVTFTATVTSTAPGTPTGSVTFKDGAATLGTGALNAAGVATFATTALAPGSHSITAVYAGDTNFLTSTSTALTQTVNLSPSSTALASSLNPSTAGQSVTFTATVTSTAAGTPTGTVTFKDGAATLGTGALNAAGVATLATSTLTAGSHSITATYGGDTNFATSTSAALTQTVKGTTNTALTSSVNPSASGQSVTFTATVTSTAAGTPTGSVTFKDGAATLSTVALNASGVAAFNTSTLTTGNHSITAVYAGDPNFAGSTSTVLTQAVNLPATTTAVTSSVNPSAFGQSVTFTATVTSTAAGTPTGTVTFKDGATTLGTGALSAAAMATLTSSALIVGSHSITAVYAGDASFAGSTSNTLTQTVNQGATTSAVVSSLNPSSTGQSVTFTATVSPVAPGAGTATGTVTFKDGAATLGTGALNASGVATLATSALTAGSHSITAVYGGDANFAGSTSPVFTQSVKGATNTALTSSVNPSATGQSVTFTATVTSTAAGTPTGNVTFKDGANTLGTTALNAAGVATLSTSTLANGSHSITAAYAGDPNFAASTSNTVTQAVNLAATVSVVTSSVNPSAFGQSVTFTATITSTAAGTPTGSVTFKDGATTLGTGTLSASAVATFSTSSLTVGTHSITAVYGGDATFATSTSTALTQTVNPAASSTTLTSSLNPSTFGQSVTFTATATSAAGTPTGTVTFKDGAATLGTGALNASGVATFATTTLSAGSHSITAVYGGDTNHLTSTSAALPQTVNKAASNTAGVSSANPSVFGNSVTFTATVTSAAGTPTGTVTFKDGAATLGTGALNASGVATFATSTLTVGSHTITAVYGGDSNFAGSTSAVLTQAVKGATTTALISSAATANLGASVTFTATVTSTSPGTPTGNVTFMDGTTSLGSAVALSGSGVATLTTATLPAGNHSITAVYAGDANFAGSTSTALTQTVNAPDFSVSATPQTQNITAGQSGMVTFTVTPLFGSKQTVTFSCSGLPAHASCTFAPPSVTLDGTNNATSTGTIQTTANAGVPFVPTPQRPQPRVPYLPLTLFALACLAALLATSLSSRQSLRRFAAFAVLLIGVALGLAACSNGGQKMATGTPPGSYSIMVTGAATGGATHAVPVTIVVK